MTPYTMDDAEAEMRAAIDSGDRERIDAAGALVDRLDAMPIEPVSLHAAALWYASVGLHVFPVSPGTKIPLKGSRGLHDGTSDPEQINAWWTATPDANIGIVTGHLVEVVDIDGLEGQLSRVAHWEDIFGKVDADAIAKVSTPRNGGMHIYLPATGDGNTAKILPGIDTRGAGGYVLAPPSVVTEGPHPGTYRFLGVPDLTSLGTD